MGFDPAVHHRRSIRLRGYDYASAGIYFFTICTHDRRLLLGAIQGGRMLPNAAGDMVSWWWYEIGNKFPAAALDAFVVMPNHMHAILSISSEAARLGARPAPLSRIVQWFKTMTTNAYLRGVKEQRWPALQGKLWQRNYFEHIVRSSKAVEAIRGYIESNPANWERDVENPSASKSARDEILDIVRENGS